MHAEDSVGSGPFVRSVTRRERLPPATGRGRTTVRHTMRTLTIEMPELPDVTSTAYRFVLAISSAE